MNYSGIIVGLISLAIIGLWHFIVIKGEYLLGKRICILIFAISPLSHGYALDRSCSNHWGSSRFHRA